MGAAIAKLNGVITKTNSYLDEATMLYGTTKLEPYRAYTAEVGNLGSNVFSGTVSGFFTALAPPGYTVEINGFIRNRVSWNLASASAARVKVRIIEIGGEYSGAVATSSELESGKIRWQLSLGTLSDGRPAGNLALVGHGRVDDWSIYRKASALCYEQISGEVYVHSTNGNISQIYTPQAFVTVTQTSTALTIKFYHPDQITGSSFPKGVSGSPFTTYNIETAGSSSSLKITKEVTDAGIAAPLSETSLTRTGASPNFTWTRKSWQRASAMPQAEEIRTWESSGTEYTETLDLNDKVASETSLHEVRIMKQFPWGAELPKNITSGAETPESTDIDYYTSSADIGSYGSVRLITKAGGGWQYLEYAKSSDPANVSNIIGTYSPFTTGPDKPAAGEAPSKLSGVYTKYAYSEDPFKMKRRLASAETKVNNVLVSKLVNSYEDVTLTPKTGSTPVTKGGVRVTRKKSTDNGTVQMVSSDVYYRENVPDYFYRNQIHSTAAPDGTRQSYVRQRGSLDASHRWGNPEPLPPPQTAPSYTFTVSSPTTKPIIAGSRICVINGLSASPGSTLPSTKLSTLYGYDITDIWVVHGRSTMEVTVRDYMGRLLRTETYVWNQPGTGSGSWDSAPIQWKEYYYDRASNLIKTIDNIGNIYEAGYTGGFKTWDRTPEGIYQEYAYDDANRLWKTTTQAKGNVGSRITEYKYDAAGRALESKSYAAATPGDEAIISATVYDQAGRIKSSTKDGITGASYMYDPVSRSATETLPDNGTKVTKLYPDGQVESITGTGTVASYRTYGVETNGRIWTSVSLGSTNSGRYTKSWKDWIGREIRKETPGFANKPTVVETQTYSAATGLLTKSFKGVKGATEGSPDQRTIADTLYEYDPFGALLRSGLDINANGSLDLAGPDTASGSTISYFKDSSGAWWLQTKASAYVTTGSAVETITGITRARLTAFAGDMRAETRIYGPETNFTNLNSLDEVDYKHEWTEIFPTDAKALDYVKQPQVALNACDTSYNGLITRSEGAEGVTITKRYDSLWRLAGTTDPRTGESTQTYKTGTNLVEHQYDARGEGNGRIASFEYDSMGRVTCQADASGHKTRTDYTLRGEAWHLWGNATLPRQTEYDIFGMRRTLTTYRSSGDDPIWNGETWPAEPPAGDVTTLDYDATSGLLWKQTDAKARIVEYTYDERGQLFERKWARKASTAADSEQITTTYSYKRTPIGWPAIEYYDGGSSPSKITYNDVGPPEAGTPDVIYGPVDRLGNPSSVQDGAGLRTFNYDGAKPWRGLESVDLPAGFYGQRNFGRVRETATNTSAGTYGEHTLATVKGRVAGFSLSIPGGSGVDLMQQARFSSKGRLAGVDLPIITRSFTYGYSADSNLLSGYSISDGGFAVSYGYEPHRDLMTQISNRWGVLRNISQYDYAYDVEGRRNTLTASGEVTQQEHGSSLFTGFAYDGRGQLLAAKVGRGGDLLRPLPGRQFGFSYDTVGNRLTSTRTTLADADSYTPNNLNQIEQRTHRFLSVSGLATTLARVAVHDKLAARSGNYWHALLPNPVAPAGNAPGFVDGAVSAATLGTSSEGKDTAQTERRPLIFPPAVEELVYDDDGNLMSDGSYTYTWDAENRLSIVEPKPVTGAPASHQRKRVTFRYDYLSRRIEKAVETAAGNGPPTWVSNERTRFLYQGWNLFAEFSVAANGVLTLTKSYTWGVDLGGTLTASGGVGALLQVRNHVSGEIHFPTYDAGGNVTSLIDASNGAIVATYEYSPFGELVGMRGAAAMANPFRFSTKFCDNETGLYYYGYRYYDPQNGRFINRDPLGDKGGLNVYAFAGNSPITSFDVWGLSEGNWFSNTWNSFTSLLGFGATNSASATLTPHTPLASQYFEGAFSSDIRGLSFADRQELYRQENPILTGVQDGTDNFFQNINPANPMFWVNTAKSIRLMGAYYNLSSTPWAVSKRNLELIDAHQASKRPETKYEKAAAYTELGLGLASFGLTTRMGGGPKNTAMRAGQTFETEILAAQNLEKNTGVWRPTPAQIDSAAFKLIVGEAEYTPRGLARGTILDSVEGGFLEIKGGASALESTYQLRLQTYRSLIENTPFTIQTTRPVGIEFGQWLNRWSVSIHPPPGAP
jgi:RHS repeat-associated protein